MNVLSLCSGIAGLDLGVSLVVPGATVVAYVERDAAAIEILAARMEERSLSPAPIYFDLRAFDGRYLAGSIDLVTAGFPCQPHSVAGKRAGSDDARWLWEDVWRVVCDVRAPLLFLENVAALLSSRGFDRILADLAARGWVAEWDCMPAAAVGAPHLRDRIFILAADADHARLPAQWCRRELVAGKRAAHGPDADRRTRARAVTPHADDEPICEQSVGHGGCVDQAGARHAPDWESAHAERDRATASDAASARLEGWRKGWARGASFDARLAPQPVVCRMDDGHARILDGDRLHVLGNAVVPQAAARAFDVLSARLGAP